ncbi:MAG: hypothetical protein COY40_01440 [Alphaproteobacteria bacterium CG_4_10_14_0_8_um_filter_53_9]|nr:MAG: hypothetical protein COY40_01440 [Alphaproteobacteria bacterium CG_4_10_14_0_8_um_filter_53_9]
MRYNLRTSRDETIVPSFLLSWAINFALADIVKDMKLKPAELMRAPRSPGRVSIVWTAGWALAPLLRRAGWKVTLPDDTVRLVEKGDMLVMNWHETEKNAPVMVRCYHPDRLGEWLAQRQLMSADEMAKMVAA